MEQKSFHGRFFEGDRLRPLYQQSWWKLTVLSLSGASLFLILTLLLTVFP